MKNQYAKRVDRSQSGIVKALRRVCGQVEVTNMGNDFPDLICADWRRWKLIEVKEIDGHFSRGQLKFLADARAPVDIVVGQDDAIASIENERQLSAREKNAIYQWLTRNPDQATIRVPKLLTLIGRSAKPIDKSLSPGSTQPTEKHLARR